MPPWTRSSADITQRNGETRLSHACFFAWNGNLVLTDSARPDSAGAGDSGPAGAEAGAVLQGKVGGDHAVVVAAEFRVGHEHADVLSLPEVAHATPDQKQLVRVRVHRQVWRRQCRERVTGSVRITSRSEECIRGLGRYRAA